VVWIPLWPLLGTVFQVGGIGKRIDNEGVDSNFIPCITFGSFLHLMRWIPEQSLSELSVTSVGESGEYNTEFPSLPHIYMCLSHVSEWTAFMLQVPVDRQRVNDPNLFL